MQNSVAKMGAIFDLKAWIALLFLGRNFARESRFQATRVGRRLHFFLAERSLVSLLRKIQAQMFSRLLHRELCQVWRSGATSLNGDDGGIPVARVKAELKPFGFP